VIVIYEYMKIHALNDVSLYKIPTDKPPVRLSKHTDQLSNRLSNHPPIQPINLSTGSEICHGNDITPHLFIRSCIHHIRSYGSFSPNILERIRSCSDDEKMEIIREMNGAMKTIIDNFLHPEDSVNDNDSPRDS
jgi:hypothetical protein